MTVTVPRLVASWGVGNAVLTSILIGYGENPFAIALYASVVALLELIAVAAWLSLARQADRVYRSPAAHRSDAALVTAIGVGFVGAGFVYQWWMALPAAYSLFWLVGHAGEALLQRYEPRDLREPPSVPEPEPEEHQSSAAVVGAATVATAAVVGRRWFRRWRRS